MDYSDEEKDALNDETFGHAEIGDWELEHERFVLENEGFDPDAPNADALPRFWESPDDFSFTWEPGALDNFQSFFEDRSEEMGVNVEETLQKLVSDEDTFEDPAILDISRKASSRNSYNSALEQILGTPSYPYGPSGILNGSKDIWSSTSVAGSLSNGSFSGIRAIAPTTDNHLVLDKPSTAKKSHDGIPLSINDLLKCVERSNKSDNASAPQSRPVSSNAQPLFNLPVFRPPFNQVFPGARFSAALQSSTASLVSPLVHTSLPGQFTRPAGPHALRPLLPCEPADMISRLQLLSLHNATNKLRTPQPTLPNINLLQYLTLSGRLNGLPMPVGLPRMPTRPIPSQQQSVLPIPNHLQTQLLLSSRNSLSRPTDAPTRLKDSPQTFPNSADKQEIFNPNIGSWMTHYESVGVLLMYLRPLIVSNPYIQDYYFAVRWLRQMYATHSKQMASGNGTHAGPPPVMYMPSPLTMENLLNPSHHHHTALAHKLVVPVISFPKYTVAKGVQPMDDTISTEASSPDKCRVESSSPTAKDAISTLGRCTRSNVNRPRVLSDLSVSSALTMGSSETSEKINQPGENSVATRSVCAVKSSRLHRLLLARIERMYTLVLHIDEVDISLSRVVVQNEIRFRLVAHRQALIDKLARELLRTSTQPTSSVDESSSTLALSSDISETFAELLGVRKGLRLFSTVLYYLSPTLLRVCLRDLVRQFHQLHPLWASFTAECATIFYPSLRHVVYQLNDISSFMKTCFPEVTDSLPLAFTVADVPPAMHTMITSKIGFSLILCLLDTCARLSRPDEPTCFVQNAAYFIYITNCVLESIGISPIVEPYEPFPHLASIIPVYVKPGAHKPLTSEQIVRFCSLLRCQPTTSQRSTLTSNSTMTETPMSPTACSSITGVSPAVFAS